MCLNSKHYHINSVHLVAQSCLTLWDPMGCSTPGLPVHHQLPEFTQTHVHWVGDAIQLSQPVVPFSSHLQSFLASGSFQMSQFFASGGQSIGVSASTSVLLMNIQNWSPLGWTDRISLWSKGLSSVFSNTTVQKHHSHPYMTSGKSIALTRRTFVGKVHLAWCQISSPHTYLLCHLGCAVYHLCGSISSSFK